MSFSINALTLDPGDSVYFDPTFRRVIETHLNIIKKDTAAQRVIVDQELAYQYQGDLYGLLGTSRFNQTLGYRWVTMRANDMHNSSDYGKEWNSPYVGMHDFSLLLPSETYIRELATKFSTTGSRS